MGTIMIDIGKIGKLISLKDMTEEEAIALLTHGEFVRTNKIFRQLKMDICAIEDGEKDVMEELF